MVKTQPTPIIFHRPPSSARGFIARTFWLSVLALGVFLSFRPTHAASPDIQKIIADTNQQRIEQGQPKLRHQPQLDEAATQRATDMFQKQYFSHYAPDGTPPWSAFRQSGYQFSQAGENLAIDFSSVDSVVGVWMDSPTHRQNILSEKFADIGVAVVEGKYEGHQTIIIVQLFGRPVGVAALTKQVEKQKPATKNIPTTLSKDTIQKKTTVAPTPIQKKSEPAIVAPEITAPVTASPTPEPVAPTAEISAPIPSVMSPEGRSSPTLRFTIVEPSIMYSFRKIPAPMKNSWLVPTVLSSATSSPTRSNTVQQLVLAALIFDAGLLSLVAVLKPRSWHQTFSLFPQTSASAS